MATGDHPEPNRSREGWRSGWKGALEAAGGLTVFVVMAPIMVIGVIAMLAVVCQILSSIYLPIRMYRVAERHKTTVVETETTHTDTTTAMGRVYHHRVRVENVDGRDFSGWHTVAEPMNRGDTCVVLASSRLGFVRVLEDEPRSLSRMLLAWPPGPWHIRWVGLFLSATLNLIVLLALVAGLIWQGWIMVPLARRAWRKAESNPAAGFLERAVLCSDVNVRLAFILVFNAAWIAFLVLLLRCVVLLEAGRFAETTVGGVFLMSGVLSLSPLPRAGCRWLMEVDAKEWLRDVRAIAGGLVICGVLLVTSGSLIVFAVTEDLRRYENISGVFREFLRQLVDPFLKFFGVG